jgi:hypothetical protein
MASAIFRRKKEKKDPAGPPPMTATLDPSSRARSPPSSGEKDEKESATDCEGERLTLKSFREKKFSVS